MGMDNLVLYVATYDDATTATEDYASLKAAEGSSDLEVVSSVVMHRGDDGKVAAIAGKIAKSHEEKKMGIELEEYLPKGSSAIVAVIDDRYLDRVEAALDKAVKKVDKAIDKDDYEELEKAINEGGDKVAKAIAS